MNMELAYKIQMYPANVRSSRSRLHTLLLGSGWPAEVVDRDIDAALRWANSHCLTQQQEKTRKQRASKKSKLKGDDAFDAMFAAMGADPQEIPRK